MNRYMKWLVASLVLLALGVPTAQAQAPNTPFSLLGFIEEFSLWTPADMSTHCPGINDTFRGARLKVNGVTVTLPCHLIIVLPGTALTPADMFRGPKATAATDPILPQSGLAMADTPPPVVPFEAQVTGNIVNGEYIAGLVKITQQDLNGGAGFIQAIDFATGELRVGTKGGSTGARVKLNDVDRRFGKGDSNADNRFTADTSNPTVTAETGYPLCIPRVVPPATDPECPATNRPKNPTGDPLTRYTIGTVPATTDAPACPTCDATKQAPLLVGDYVTYAGTMARDAQGLYLSAHSLHSPMGIYTSPCTLTQNAGCNSPAYLNLEEVLFGAAGAPFPDIDVETGPGKKVDGEPSTAVKVVAFTTDPSRQVEVVAIDHDPATHTEQLRVLTTMTPQVTPFGRVRTGLEAVNLLPPPREVKLRIKGYAGPSSAANGLEPAQYTAPIAEYIFPENTGFGQVLYPANFENLCFLRRGSGKYEGLGRDPGLNIAPLRPFPESGHPNPQANPVCS